MSNVAKPEKAEIKTIPGFSDYNINSVTLQIINRKTEHVVQAFKRGGVFKLNLISDDGKRRSVLQSRMLALTFLPNPKKLPKVLHINGDQLNNNLYNLKWATGREVIINTVRNQKNA